MKRSTLSASARLVALDEGGICARYGDPAFVVVLAMVDDAAFRT